MDITRETGSIDPVRIRGRGRDLVTAADGSTTELDTADLTVTVRMTARAIESIGSDPPTPAPELCQSRDLSTRCL